jgi:signal transduction histidine kinase
MTVYDQGGRLWLGGAYGLEVFDEGRFRKINISREGQFVGISGIVQLANGDLWLNGANGILHVLASEIQHALIDPGYQASFHLFDHLDGLLGTSALLRARPTAVQTTDGKIWFSVGNGIVWIDPTHSLKNTLPPPVYVKSLSANGNEYLNNPLELPVHSTNIRIDYTALSLSIPERVAFRYKLDSVDKEWQDPGNRRTAFYTNLRPGHHLFQVIASNNDGVWNEAGATLQFDILPAFYQTKWFGVLCLAMAASLVWAAYRYRVRQVTNRLDMQFEERIAERTRIAGELHDTLLQSVQGLILHFQRARNLFSTNPAEAVQRLDLALERAEEAIVEGRNAIHDIRSSTLVESDLAQALATLGEELGARAGNDGSEALKIVTEGVARPVNPRVREDIYRIVREALRNAFTHSKAQLIEVEIMYEENIFRVRVRDDGKGMDPAVVDQVKPSGHWGLVGMRERAKRIGGELDVWSENKAGTEIELTLPGSIAYEPFSSGGGFRLFRRRKSGHQ